MKEPSEKVDLVPKRHAYFSLVRAFLNFFRHARLYEKSNQIFGSAIKQIMNAMVDVEHHFKTEQTLEVSFHGDQLFVNGERVRPQMRQLKVNKLLIELLRERKVASFTLPFRASEETLLNFLWLIVGVDANNAESVAKSKDLLASAEFDGFKLSSRLDGDEIEERALEDLEVLAVTFYRAIVKDLSIYFDNFELSKNFELQGLEKNLKNLVGIPDDEIFQALRISEKNQADQSMADMGGDAALLSLAWSRSMGIPQGISVELARVAALHPLIYIARSGRSLERLDQDSSLRLLGFVERLSELEVFTPAQRLALFELTEAYDTQGIYTVDRVRCYSHFYSRLLRIVCYFRLLLKGKSTGDSLLPDEAIAQMLKDHSNFDTGFLKLFVNWMGIYPVGSLVELQTGELAQVFSGGADPLKFQRPIVSILTNSSQAPLERPFLADLSELNRDLGVYRRSIRKSVRLSEVSLPDRLLQTRPVGF